MIEFCAIKTAACMCLYLLVLATVLSSRRNKSKITRLSSSYLFILTSTYCRLQIILSWMIWASWIFCSSLYQFINCDMYFCFLHLLVLFTPSAASWCLCQKRRSSCCYSIATHACCFAFCTHPTSLNWQARHYPSFLIIILYQSQPHLLLMINDNTK